MTKFQRDRAKTTQEMLAEINQAVDKEADKALEEVQKSRWTGAILIIAAVIVAAIGAGFVYLF